MTATAIERRSTAGVVELRAAGDAGKKIGGYALLYGKYSQNLGGYVEQCAPGLADKSLADGVDVLCRYQHDSDMLLGRVSAATLRLASDGTGVSYEDDLPATSYASDLAALCARGDVRHSSFAFRCIEDEWGFTQQGFPLRTLLQVMLVDVAPVVNPAYLDTTTGLRSLAEQRGLDLGDVQKAAAANGLAELLRSRAPKVIDLGARPPAKRDGGSEGDSCGCCQTCADATGPCPGCDCEECRGCQPKRSTEPAGTETQGDTHVPLSAYQRRLGLLARR
jgi:uncharacterized protein